MTENLIDLLYRYNRIKAGVLIANSKEDENEAEKGVEEREVSRNNVPSEEDAEEIQEDDQTRINIFPPLDTNSNRKSDGVGGWKTPGIKDHDESDQNWTAGNEKRDNVRHQEEENENEPGTGLGTNGRDLVKAFIGKEVFSGR